MRAICGDLSPTTEFSEFFYSPKVIKYRKCVTCLFAKPRCSQFTSPLNRSFINKRYSTESDWVVSDWSRALRVKWLNSVVKSFNQSGFLKSNEKGILFTVHSNMRASTPSTFYRAAVISVANFLYDSSSIFIWLTYVDKYDMVTRALAFIRQTRSMTA